MTNESKPTTTDTLLECDVCGSIDFCITQEKPFSFIWVRCRQCDKIAGSLAPHSIHNRRIARLDKGE